MKMEDILQLIKSLASSQGSYGRLYRDIINLPEDDYNNLKLELEAMDFKDSIDFILFIEG